jgi:uncharacterized protein Yka (UPF0111/DUF47 family)
LGKISLIPRENKFFELFIQSASNMSKAARALEDLLKNWENIDYKFSYITELEHEGDSLTHQVAAMLYRTFVTPFDREDIAQLSHVMDDVTDFIHAAAESIHIYKVDSPTQRAIELAEIIVQAAAEVERAVKCLGNRSNLKKLSSIALKSNASRIKPMRSTGALGRIIRRKQGYQVHKSSGCEIYDHMESATDRCEDVANVLEGVALKNA